MCVNYPMARLITEEYVARGGSAIAWWIGEERKVLQLAVEFLALDGLCAAFIFPGNGFHHDIDILLLANQIRASLFYA